MRHPLLDLNTNSAFLAMAPEGWLDVHAHFYFPASDDEAKKLVKLFRETHFMVSEPSEVQWDPEKIIAYNDSAGVQMQLLSYLPSQHEKLRAANDYGHEVVKNHPSRFGLLAALPTDDANACLAEIERVGQFDEPKPDGYCTTTVYNDVPLSDPRLNPVWEHLNNEEAVIHVHPNAYKAGDYGKPGPLIDVAFDTAKVATDMLYKGVFRRYPNIKWIFAHCGGALPVLSGRLSLLGTESWVPNPEGLTREEIETQLANLYVDTAATAKTGLAPAIKMVGAGHCLYGADCGVPCSNARTMNENMRDVTAVEKELDIEAGTIARNTWKLFPAAAARA